MLVRPAEPADHPAVWAIIEPVIRAGETFALDRDMSEDAALKFWAGFGMAAYVAEDEGEVVGTYYMRPNHAGGGSHVCNAGFAVRGDRTGRGVARAMGLHALEEARLRRFHAMQFNFVVSSNERAVRLWHSLGFETVGRLPEAFRHPRLGLVDALVMFQRL
jgi:GNAT superfamily N-acetyltransferase